jgi:hypothetical protein
MKLRPLPIKALLLAPLASIPAATLAGLGSSDAGIASDFKWGFFLSVVLAVPASYIGMLVMGLPLFILLRNHKVALLLVACAVGLVTPYVIFSGAPSATLIMALAAGLAVSVTAYLLRPIEPMSD